MPTGYPGALDVMPNPLPNTLENAPGFELDVVISNLGDAIQAIEAKLGIGASAAAVNQVLRATGVGASAFGAVQTADVAAGAISQRLLSALFSGTRTAAGLADVDSTNGKLTYTATGGDLFVLFAGYVTNPTAGVAQQVALRLDAGAEVSHQSVYCYPGAGSFPMPFCAVALFFGVAAGSHSVYARHNNISAAGTMTTQGQMYGLELKR